MTCFTTENRCRSCRSHGLETVLDLGHTPLADRLASPERDGPVDPLVPLTLAFCPACSLVQIRESVSPELLFDDEYPYLSSISATFRRHAMEYAKGLIRSRSLGPGSRVIEIASNDGCLLRHFMRRGIAVLGIDPAGRPAQHARAAGVPTLQRFFDRSLALTLRDRGISADVLIANNVLAHVADLDGFVEGLKLLLKPGGVAVVEVPYLIDLMQHLAFDTIYHQHRCYFSFRALESLLGRHGLSVNSVEHYPMQGGSLRIFATTGGDRTPAVVELRRREAGFGVARAESYRRFSARVRRLRRRLLELLQPLKAAGCRLVGYGAAAKATTLLSYCGIDRRLLDYIVDRNPVKQGLCMAGNRLPILEPSRLMSDRPDFVLLLAWNYAEEIMRQESAYRSAGGRFIVPLPRPGII